MLRVHLKYLSHGDFLISIPRAYHEHTFLNKFFFFIPEIPRPFQPMKGRKKA